MFGNIDGADKLCGTIPPELCYWSRFGRISSLTHRHITDDSGRDIALVEMILTDSGGEHLIKLSLYNAVGRLCFDMKNGFFGGLAVEDCAGRGYEGDCRYHVYSSEQDIEFELYCESIGAEYISGE